MKKSPTKAEAFVMVSLKGNRPALAQARKNVFENLFSRVYFLATVHWTVSPYCRRQQVLDTHESTNLKTPDELVFINW